MQTCNIKSPATLLDPRLEASGVRQKLDSLLPEEVQILMQTCRAVEGAGPLYISDWTAALRSWDPLGYLLSFNPKITKDGDIALDRLRPPHDLDSIRSLLQAVPDLDTQLRAAASPYSEADDERDDLIDQYQEDQLRRQQEERSRNRVRFGSL